LVRFGIAARRGKLAGMSRDVPPEIPLITPGRLAEIVEDIDRMDVFELAALLAAFRTAAWPTRFALEN
jgi:hypothetical protein